MRLFKFILGNIIQILKTKNIKQVKYAQLIIVITARYNNLRLLLLVNSMNDSRTIFFYQNLKPA